MPGHINEGEDEQETIARSLVYLNRLLRYVILWCYFAIEHFLHILFCNLAFLVG